MGNGFFLVKNIIKETVRASNCSLSFHQITIPLLSKPLSLSLLNPEKETKKKTLFFSQYKGDQINQLQPNAAVGFRTASPVIYPNLKIQKDGAFLSGSGPVARVGGCGYGSVRE